MPKSNRLNPVKNEEFNTGPASYNLRDKARHFTSKDPVPNIGKGIRFQDARIALD